MKEELEIIDRVL